MMASVGTRGKPRLRRRGEVRAVKRTGFITAWLAMAVLGLGLGVAPSAAQRRPPQQPRREQNQNRPHAGDWLRRYKDLPPEQQRKALENDPQFRRLPPERQQQLRQRLQHFNSLPPLQQERILNRMETWEHLTPEQKEKARGLFQQLQQLPPERRQAVQGAIRELRSTPPEQREQLLNSERYESQFSPQERQLLRGTSQLPLAPPENPRENEGPEEQ